MEEDTWVDKKSKASPFRQEDIAEWCDCWPWGRLLSTLFTCCSCLISRNHQENLPRTGREWVGTLQGYTKNWWNCGRSCCRWFCSSSRKWTPHVLPTKQEDRIVLGYALGKGIGKGAWKLRTIKRYFLAKLEGSPSDIFRTVTYAPSESLVFSDEPE